ncbi:virulence metalloprotease (plasmid) [Legionella adelaidensis]|uniref:Neutral metalloproteinase n=1 Tax=Legionella adelaidensis TaxID=45056 RepID=A0A0W0R2P4_9GAMM|nr:M4 family metallopeptidase [Legionella adelaidensis]KTC65333.1 virulence metalloprotease [Legionella adelaidensis]VEH86016.1 virulence metalloprotease [Legionella adelaidensis]
MKRMISLVAFGAVINANAATQQLLWGETTKEGLASFTGFSNPQNALITNQSQPDYQLKRLKPSGSPHTRYQQMYKMIPIWGHEIIVHSNKNKSLVTGMMIKEIEQDIPILNAQFTAAAIEEKLSKKITDRIKFKKTEKIIFLDPKKKAHLAYHVVFYTNGTGFHIHSPNYIVDAQSGAILKEWDNMHSENIGQGMGGNSFPLPYRSGVFQHGNAFPGFPSLGKFDVQVVNGFCLVENETFRTINLKNTHLGYDAFPVTTLDEREKKLDVFSYPCDALSQYINFSDGLSGPINYSYSPINDTMYFAQKTIEMYQAVYHQEKPLGDDLPLRAYTHLGGMDNAFSIPTIYVGNHIYSHQQIVIGNGDQFLTAPAQTVVGHELSHNFTELNSRLIYDGQSGGINEAFSDMAAIALQDYLRQEYPWYWDGEDWSLGREAVIGGSPLRFMDEPSKDGHSISHADDYHDELNVHFSSGVFNKAFYLLAHKPDWSIQKAFQVMVDANKNYWAPLAYYDFAACGVIQATYDREWDAEAVIAAFDEVGVHCPIHHFPT